MIAHSQSEQVELAVQCVAQSTEEGRTFVVATRSDFTYEAGEEEGGTPGERSVDSGYWPS
jgi:hypothetical protein